MTDVTIQELDDVWEQSTDEPHTLFAGEDPEVQTGSYVIQPGERVPETGTTAHEGTEISVILEGEIRLIAAGEEWTVGPNTLTVLPAGVEHHSENRGSEPVRLVYTVLGEL